jgi:murein DD-endopeptidase MepM/ murein hydrolase activator NlpD
VNAPRRRVRWLDFLTFPGILRLGLLLGSMLSVFLFGFLIWNQRPRRYGIDRAASQTRSSSGLLLFPVLGGSRAQVVSGFEDRRGTRQHNAVDIHAKRGTPVVAVDDGTLEQLSNNGQGGLGLYLRSVSSAHCYYYAHLDRYANGLKLGQALIRGQLIGYVGSTGNADDDAPHLHFAVFRLETEQRCARGTPIDPQPLLGGE